MAKKAKVGQITLLNPNFKTKHISKNITIVDDILKDYVLIALRLRMQLANKFQDFYKDYKAINYYLDDPLTNDLVKDFYKTFKLKDFKRAWSFLYENKADGVGFHADPSNINVNIWLTPNESIEDYSKNGLLICDIKPPKNWTREQWNGNLNNCTNKFLQKEKPNIYKIEYKCNRAIFFNGALFHKTDSVQTKNGILNKRVSYTMLFGEGLK